MSKIFFSADSHWGHKNILTYGGRPFTTIEEHDETLIRNWNEKISQQDIVYHLGDFSFAKPERTERIIRRLNGQKFLVRGNHDHQIKGDLEKMFGWVKDYYKLKMKDEAGKIVQEIVLCHFPFHIWDKRHYGAWHLHGHCHGNLKTDLTQMRMDVGVDCHNYFPISYEEIRKEMKKRTFEQLDHHSDKNKR